MRRTRQWRHSPEVRYLLEGATLCICPPGGDLSTNAHHKTLKSARLLIHSSTVQSSARSRKPQAPWVLFAGKVQHSVRWNRENHSIRASEQNRLESDTFGPIVDSKSTVVLDRFSFSLGDALSDHRIGDGPPGHTEVLARPQAAAQNCLRGCENSSMCGS